MAAIAFNLKKYLKKGGGKPSIGTIKTIKDAFRGFMAIFYPANPTKTGSPKGLVKTTCSDRYHIRRPLLPRPQSFILTFG